VRIEDGTVALGVPSQFARDWLSTKFHKDILRSLRGLSESVRTVEYVISRGIKKTSDEAARMVPPPPAELPLETVHAKTNLNPRFSLNTFVVGPFNELAHAAAQAVIRKPGIAYNPLLIYGPTGLGKTHLITSHRKPLQGADPRTQGVLRHIREVFHGLRIEPAGGKGAEL